MHNPPPPLPVADLEQTLARYLKQVKPLVAPGQYRLTEKRVQHFLKHSGPVLQNMLQESARENPRSWLIDAWLESYLRIRSPLPLASNVAFALRDQGKDAAAWAYSLAAVCADHIHGRFTPAATPQGGTLCTAQRQILNGAARIPRSRCDGFYIAERPGRHIGIFHNGFYYRTAALDEHHEALPPETLRAVFAQIAAETDTNPYPVATASCLGGNAGAALYRRLAAHPDNAELLEHIENDLFHVSLYSRDLDADDDLADAAFVPRQNVWCLKPLTLCCNGATGRFFLHCEHTWPDGGTLKSIVALAAGKTPAAAPSAPETPPAAVRRTWHLGDTQKKNWPQWQQDYKRRAAELRASSATAAFPPQGIPAGVSHDALMQFLMQYAQLATYGSVRNTYEAVDASHFRNGRTECVRPVSEESLAFATSLIQDRPDPALFSAALAEHKARIKAAKLGQGPNRHLLGLQLEARRKGSRPALFQDPSYQTFTTDFLSTSTLGDDAFIINFAFAPTAKGGLGVNYTLSARGWLFTVSCHAAQKQEAAIFLEALKEGAEKLSAFLGSLPDAV